MKIKGSLISQKFGYVCMLVWFRETRGNEKNIKCLSVVDALLVWVLKRKVSQATLLAMSNFHTDFCLFLFVVTSLLSSFWSLRSSDDETCLKFNFLPYLVFWATSRAFRKNLRVLWYGGNAITVWFLYPFCHGSW